MCSDEKRKSAQKILSLALLCVFVPLTAMGQSLPQYPPIIPDARTEIYKTIGNVELRLWIFTPDGHSNGKPRPAIVFFFGGGWRSGSPAQFTKQCEYLAARGMVAITADYRVASRHEVKVSSCVADAKSAIRWIRGNSSRLGIDANRIVASGGSAGGHLAASAAVLPGHDDVRDDLSISSKPNALVLYNPAVIVAPLDGYWKPSAEELLKRKARFGEDLQQISPYHHISKGVAPTLILHGKADSRVPFRSVELFCEEMQKEGNRCDLIGYESAQHGFFNYGPAGNVAFADTMSKTDAFLVDLGYLKSAPSAESSK